MLFPVIIFKSGKEKMLYLLLLVNILLMTAGQLFFKQSAIYANLHPDLDFFQKYLLNPWFYGAVSFFGVATITWVQVLTYLKLSVAYPILSISYILVALGAFYFFGEKLSLVNILGIFLIMCGVSLVSIK
ncbi:MAG: hypothetical protein FJZ04_02780 [Candidatus Moranbacteria bacterium]|nr:hypothetical protein [Candidatus Moranbacteria bacterium]